MLGIVSRVCKYQEPWIIFKYILLQPLEYCFHSGHTLATGLDHKPIKVTETCFQNKSKYHMHIMYQLPLLKGIWVNGKYWLIMIPPSSRGIVVVGTKIHGRKALFTSLSKYRTLSSSVLSTRFLPVYQASKHNIPTHQLMVIPFQKQIQMENSWGWFRMMCQVKDASFTNTHTHILMICGE